MIAFFEMTFSTLGLAGLAGLWVLKATEVVYAPRWLRDKNTRRKGLG